MKKLGAVMIGLLVVLFLATVFSGLYTIREDQQVIITQFQAPVGDPITEAGLHWKVPFIQEANYFDKRWLEWDGEPNQKPTLDKKYIWVDTYARWRIAEPKLFFMRVKNEEGAQARLDYILDGQTREAISKYKLLEIVRSENREFVVPDDFDDSEGKAKSETIEHGRAAIMADILKAAKPAAAESGIELVDVRIKRINYIPDVRTKVYERMIFERKRIAEKYRSEGKGESEKILGDMEKELKRIQSEAFKRSQEIIGEADAKATKIYAEAYSKDPEFYAFWKSMETFKETIGKDTWLILGTEGEMYKYIK